jgi:lipopolysaccharide/colanic/teichoic acid biosynthesis glycosyltransferase
VLFRLPSSHARLRLCLSPVDVAMAAVSPFVALYLRDTYVYSTDDWTIVGSYSVVSLAFALIMFQIFGIGGIVVRYISANDILNIAKAVLGAELMTAIVLFTVTRLEGIPRSVPAIHALILGAGLLAYRVANLSGRRHRHADQLRRAAGENVILIGLNDWSVLVMKYLQAQGPERRRLIALLDDDPRWIGRSVNGVRVFGPPEHLETVIEEFETHGLRTDRVLVSGQLSELSEQAAAEVRSTCAQRNLDLVFLPHLNALGFEESCRSARKGLDQPQITAEILLSQYFRVKRGIDAIVAFMLIFTLLPLLVLTGLIVLFDVGWPVLFWQQRMGRAGRELQLYKLRTLRPPFDRSGQRIPEKQRLSAIGRLLRQTRFDELPQLLNVLVGDMSLIGPRPLLPRDQPPNATLRLTVRPGITGWAQVNGGILLSSTEKNALDIWYIRNASLRLDLRIIGMTLLGLVKSDRRGEDALAQAMQLHYREPGSGEALSTWLITANTAHPDEAEQHAA